MAKTGTQKPGGKTAKGRTAKAEYGIRLRGGMKEVGAAAGRRMPIPDEPPADFKYGPGGNLDLANELLTIETKLLRGTELVLSRAVQEAAEAAMSRFGIEAVQVPLEPAIRKRAGQVLAAEGTNLTSVMRLLAHYIAVHGEIPFDPARIPNKTTIAALDALDRDEGIPVTSVESLLEDLDAE